jgi:hypothetical protein
VPSQPLFQLIRGVQRSKDDLNKSNEAGAFVGLNTRLTPFNPYSANAVYHTRQLSAESQEGMDAGQAIFTSPETSKGSVMGVGAEIGHRGVISIYNRRIQQSPFLLYQST